MPEHDHPTDVTLHELMTGNAREDAPTTVAPTSDADREAASNSTPSELAGAASSDDGDMLDDDYLLQQPRRIGRLTVVLLVALIFVLGFIAGVVAAGIVS